jgi:hypothetical protein
MKYNERIDMMIEKTLNVAITKCYGNADEDNTRGKLNIPKKMLKAMGITENDRTVKITYNEAKNELIIIKV